MSDQSVTTVTLPPGVKISAGRETTQLGPNNQNIQGMVFNLTTIDGSQSSVFVPYTLFAYPNQVTALFANRVAGISAITSLATG